MNSSFITRSSKCGKHGSRMVERMSKIGVVSNNQIEVLLRELIEGYIITILCTEYCVCTVHICKS
jgi:hypothetical protein